MPTVRLSEEHNQILENEIKRAEEQFQDALDEGYRDVVGVNMTKKGLVESAIEEIYDTE